MPDTQNIDAPVVTMFNTPDLAGEPVNTLLYGERIKVLSEEGDAAKVQSENDGYQGYIDAELMAVHRAKTHKVVTPMTHLYEEPDFKAVPFVPLYMLSHVHATDEKQNGFVKLGNGKWVFEGHLGTVDAVHYDYAEMALKFLYTPYVWGGRTAAGIDCSGLVQLCMNAAGVQCPRDTRDQMALLGEDIGTKDPTKLRRGDFVFFERHVGIMLDKKLIVNATSRHMSTVVEELTTLIDAYKDILIVRRMFQG
ncbi:MAG: C40 family peptidase [Alphaproteobacteria bacterium]|nr:C40 family peptidase [Alphaproteobacteria bacterium]